MIVFMFTVGFAIIDALYLGWLDKFYGALDKKMLGE